MKLTANKQLETVSEDLSNKQEDLHIQITNFMSKAKEDYQKMLKQLNTQIAEIEKANNSKVALVTDDITHFKEEVETIQNSLNEVTKEKSTADNSSIRQIQSSYFKINSEFERINKDLKDMNQMMQGMKKFSGKIPFKEKHDLLDMVREKVLRDIKKEIDKVVKSKLQEVMRVAGIDIKLSPVKKYSNIKRKTTILSNKQTDSRENSVFESISKIKNKLQRGETTIINNLRFNSRLAEKSDSNPLNFGAMK